MKKHIIVSVLMLLAAVALFAQSETNSIGRSRMGGQPGSRYDTRIDAIAPSPLSADEADSLVYMREEEKLARDVYTALYEIWQYPIFANISRSEQRHMDAVRVLIDRYDLQDPAAADIPGTFESQELQELYNELMETGGRSLSDALSVGVRIEELDISDLLVGIENTDNEDIASVYENLLKGSRNHLASFSSRLESF